MEEGVFVLAARDGKVMRTRDGEPDKIRTRKELEKLEEKECGNGILIDHGEGLQTLYCHLRQNSLRVEKGDKVVALQPIAKAGHSGLAEFPHLHFEVIKNNKTLDPFTGKFIDQGCGHKSKSMWREDVEYNPVAIYEAGFSGSVPSYETLQKHARKAEKLPADSKALVFWSLIYGPQKGDEIVMKITAPDGEVISGREITQEKSRARQFYYIGKKISSPLPAGRYYGEITLKRTSENGKTLERRLGRKVVIRP
jgi:hypothetical protein